MIKQVLDGNLDGNQYEDMLREMFGIHAYIGFTMDKVVQNIVRQLQHIVGDEIAQQCTDLYLDESKATEGQATGGSFVTQHLRVAQETAYQKKAEQLLADENCMKIMLFKEHAKLTIEYLDTDTVESEDGQEIERWSEYIEKYVKEDDTISDELKERLSRKPVFLPRNIPLWRLKTADNKADLIEVSKERTNKVVTRNSTVNNNNGEDGSSKTGEKKQSSAKNSKANSPVDGSSNNNDDNEAENTSDKDLEISENTQCRFNVNNYKMVFVVDSECYMYRRMSIKKARLSHKRVSQTLYSKFNEFHTKWLEKGDKEECKIAVDWMEGREYEDHKSSKTDDKMEVDKPVVVVKKVFGSKTIQLPFDDDTKSPYRPFRKYTVEAVSGSSSKTDT
jgi:paired amphipathic helix protein Sin3a